MPGGDDDIHGLTEARTFDRLTHRLKHRVGPKNVRDTRRDLVLTDQSRQRLNSLQARTEWLFDQQMDPGLDEPRGHRYVQMGGRRDYRNVTAMITIVQDLVQTGITVPDMVTIGNGLSQFIVDLT